MVARFDVGDFAADRIDDAGGFMAENRGRGKRVEAINEMKVAMADAAGDGAHQDLALTRLVDLDVFDRKGLIRPMKNCGFHRGTPCDAGLNAHAASCLLTGAAVATLLPGVPKGGDS